MSFSANVFRVMIASPSDVTPEREVVREVVHAWNALHASDRGAVLLPVAWETHAAPEMGDRPQGIINKRLLRDCDLVIAVFWTRVGTPTGVAASGTIEEIEEHIAAGRAAMLYFSQAPVRLDSVDTEQYAHLAKFRTSVQSRGLYETYESLPEFRDKLMRQLTATMIRIAPGRPSAVGGVVSASDFVLEEPADQVLSLSNDAQQLLRVMGADDRGSLMRVAVMGGIIFQAGGKVLSGPSNGRDAARWDSAIKELQNTEFVEQTSQQMYRLTHQGFQAADRLGSKG